MISRLFPALLVALIPQFAARADDRLDAILSELRALRAQVSELEARVAQIEGAPAVQAVAAPAADDSKAAPEKDRWYDKMRIELRKAEARASGPWTEPAAWDRVVPGMKESEVRALLGEPTQEKFSVRKDTDLILIYQGDLDGNGQLVEGEVRIRHGKVTRFEKPEF